jgi:hypothetical protein
MATITIYLKYSGGDLQYSTDNVTYQDMTETSIVGANPGDTVVWTCADDSIDKINNINVGKTKTSGGNWKDIWSSKPAATDNTKRIYSGVVSTDPESPTNPALNGYDINYKIKNGGNVDKDPTIQVPQP